MNPKGSTRFILLFFLFTAGIITLLGIIRCLEFISLVSFNVQNILYVLGLLGSTAIFAFISLTVRDLFRRKLIAKSVFIIGMGLSILAGIVALSFSYALMQDFLGAYCAGFFGERSSCTLSPLLLLYVFILHPLSLAVVGLVSIYGLYARNKVKNRSADI